MQPCKTNRLRVLYHCKHIPPILCFVLYQSPDSYTIRALHPGVFERSSHANTPAGRQPMNALLDKSKLQIVLGSWRGPVTG